MFLTFTPPINILPSVTSANLAISLASVVFPPPEGPTNATCSYFSDCSSKIESWTCNSGYSKSGSSCVEDTPCISYDGQDCAYSGCPTYTCTCCPSFGGFNSSCCMYDDMCTTAGHPMCTDAVPYVVGSCCCPTSTQTSTYNCDCCVSEVQ